MNNDDMELISIISTELNLALLNINYLYKKSVNVKDAEEYINMGLREIYEHKQKYLENRKGE